MSLKKSIEQELTRRSIMGDHPTGCAFFTEKIFSVPDAEPMRPTGVPADEYGVRGYGGSAAPLPSMYFLTLVFPFNIPTMFFV